MARSCPKLSPLLLAWALPVLAAAPAAAPPALDFSGLPISVDAASSEVDGKTNAIAFHKVVISQGATRVQADQAHATGLTFANSRWTFEGNVQIDAEQHGNLHSDQAIVEFKDNHIARAIVTGKPAEFEQKRADSPQIARGHADQIVYDVSDGTVRLSDDAWLSDGQREISAPLLVYNIREQRVQAATSPGTDQRVHISISPSKGAPKQPTATPESQPHP
jgi:lipopolysaccharide transport protein LptA